MGRQMRLRDLDTSLDQLEGLRPRFTSTKPSRFVATKVSRPAAITPTSTYGLLRFIQDTATLCSLPALCTGRVRYRDPVSDKDLAYSVIARKRSIIALTCSGTCS